MANYFFYSDEAHLEFAFEATRVYTQERMAFGESLSQKQAIRHKMADIKTDIVIWNIMVVICVPLDLNISTQEKTKRDTMHLS